jgi:hypothetical protein
VAGNEKIFWNQALAGDYNKSHQDIIIKEVAMRITKFAGAFLIACLLALTAAGIASAHTTVHNGPYNVEIGWLDEPPIVGQMNAIVMNLSTNEASPTPVTLSTSELTLTVSYGGQSKVLTLQPLGEDTPGQYVAPMLPTVAGLYTVDVTGTLGTTAVKVEVQPEEVLAPDSVQFPIVAQASSGNGLGLAGWLGLGGMVIGLAALVLGVLALRKSH